MIRLAGPVESGNAPNGILTAPLGPSRFQPFTSPTQVHTALSGRTP